MFGAYILDTAEFEENVDFLKESGIRSLVFGFATPPKVLQRAGENFEVYPEYQPFAAGGIPGYFVENVLGKHRDLSALGCPTNAELQRANLHKLEKRLSEGHFSGVILDFVRYPSPADETFFYSCFCKNCRQTSKSLGYDMDEFKKNIQQFTKNPNFELLAPWLSYKKEAISSYVKEFSDLIKIKKSAFLFSPSLAPLVGQDYASLSSFLDKIHPMLYPEGSLGPASIGYEIYSLVSGHPPRELIKVYKHLGLENPKNPITLEYLKLDGMPDEIIKNEAKKAVQLSNVEVQPIITILNIPPERAAKRTQLALSEVDDVLLFGFKEKYRQNLKFLKKY